MAGYTSHYCDFDGTLLEVVAHNRSIHISYRNEVTSCCICSEQQLAHNLRKHIRRQHPSHCTVHCPACNEPFVGEVDMQNHLRNGCKDGTSHRYISSEPAATLPRIWPCDLCRKYLRKKEGVDTHKKFVHGVTSCGSSSSRVSSSPPVTIPTDLNTFLDCCGPGDVHKYISQHLQTDESYRKECSDVVDRVATFFMERSGFKLKRFIKGGSLGKGTAIKSKSDIDCVMFTSNLPSIDSKDYEKDLKILLKRVEDQLKTSSSSIAYNLEVIGRTKHAVKLRVQSHKRDHAAHDVDLLLATDLLGEDPTDVEKAVVYNTMARLDDDGKQNCSAALVELQRDFVKKQPAEVKDLIRLVKMWKKSCVWETSLTSYPLELLCIHTWPSYGTVPAAFKAVLQKLSNYSSICAYWNGNYSYNRVEAMLGKRPLILDPANPYNNVAGRCKDWPAVARAAQETLQKPFFSRC